MTDAEIIENLGGPTALAKRLKYEKLGGAQRVANWKKRGIPASVKVAFPHIFLADIRRKTRKESAVA